MKITVFCMLVCAAFAGTADSADIMELPASKGNISFPHKKHQLMLKDCTKCHASPEGGKIPQLGMDWAHKTCRGCHGEMMKGPQACRDCHKKKG